MSSTARFALPLLSPGQAQKEITHNEALTLIDALVQPCAESAGTNVPPDTPAAGQMWIVGDSPSGAWGGHASALAVWTGGGWRFVAPREGMSVHARDQGVEARFADGAWIFGMLTAARLMIGGSQVVGDRQPAIDAPTGGAVLDSEARTAIAAMLDAMRTHGLIAA